MRKFRKKLTRLLVLGLAVLLLGTSTATAANDCRLRVAVCDDAGNPVPEINVELFQVALSTGAGCTLTPAFADVGISAGELLADPGAENAERLFQFVYAKELNGQIRRTDDNGFVDFPALEKGIYLVIDRGEQAVSFQPYLVVLPAEVDGHLENDVISAPKTSGTDTRTLLVAKLWNDNMDAAGNRPSYIDVTVLQDNVPVRKVSLSAENHWQHMFYMLPAGWTYTVTEKTVAGYQAEYIPVAEGYLILNSYTGFPGGGGNGGDDDDDEPTPIPAHVSVRKVWDDHNDAAGKRPASITVQLIQGGTIVRTASLSAANQWAHTFSNLDPAKRYTVQEIAVANYVASYAGTAATGITITNTYSGSADPGVPPTPIVPEPKLIDIPVVVRWIDNDNSSGKRPAAVTVHLLADGSIVSTLQISPDNQWEGVFRNVPADLLYSVWESVVDEYTTTYGGDAATGFVITNEYTEGTTDPGVPPDPTDPVDPDPPTPPAPPADPDDPTDPADPDNPTPPAPPTVPDDPTNPADPDNPTPPAPPTDPDDPADPVDPPDVPVVPTIPQTGAEILPVYLLMAAGVLLVLLGIIDLFRGRKEV